MTQEVNYDGIRIDIKEGIRIAEEDNASGEAIHDGIEYVLGNQESTAQKAAVLDVLVEDFALKQDGVLEQLDDPSQFNTFHQLVHETAVVALHDVIAVRAQ